MKKMAKLEADMAELEKSLSQLRIIHQAEIERKDAFCEVERPRSLRSYRIPTTLSCPVSYEYLKYSFYPYILLIFLVFLC